MSTVYAQVWERYGDWKRFLQDTNDRMTAHGVTGYALADRMGSNRGRVYQWLKGETKPSLAVLLYLDEALDQLIADKGGPDA